MHPTLDDKIKKEAEKERSKAKRGVKKSKRALRKENARRPVDIYVDELVDKLGKQSKMPRGILESEVFASARTKDRQIIYTKAERREAVQLGLLRNDIYTVMHSSHKDITTRLAMRNVFGTEQSKDVVSRVRNSYNDMIRDARKRNLSDRHIRGLEKERENMIKDVEVAWDKHLGQYAIPEDPDSFIMWGMEKLRSWNYLKYGTGFIIPSITDLATVTLTSSFHSFAPAQMKALHQSMKGMRRDEVRRLAVASERVLQNSRTLKMADVADTKAMAGIGDQGTKKHKITSAVDRAMQDATNTTTTLSAMTWWNTRLKALAMIEMQHNFATTMRQYDELLTAASAGNKKARLEIGKLASLGIGRNEARRIQAMLNKYEPQKVDGVFELDASRWLNEGEAGHKAFDDVMSGLRRAAKRAVMTPGIGDLPHFMSHGAWRTIMQFQTYGYVSVSKFVLPAIQRGATYGDVESILSMAFAAGLGTGVIAAKDYLRNGKIKERTPDQWAYDILDRSGYLMYLSAPSAQVYNWAAWAAGSKSRPSRYSQNSNQLAMFLGPSGGTLSDIVKTMTNLKYGDTDAAGKHAQKLLPFHLYQQVGEQLLNLDN